MAHPLELGTFPQTSPGMPLCWDTHSPSQTPEWPTENKIPRWRPPWLGGRQSLGIPEDGGSRKLAARGGLLGPQNKALHPSRVPMRSHMRHFPHPRLGRQGRAVSFRLQQELAGLFNPSQTLRSGHSVPIYKYRTTKAQRMAQVAEPLPFPALDPRCPPSAPRGAGLGHHVLRQRTPKLRSSLEE